MAEKDISMQELIDKLTKASDAYYNGNPIMTDHEFDTLYNQLERMEQETGIVLPGSPTHNVGAEIPTQLKKVRHEFPALSLDKTKDVARLAEKFTQVESAARSSASRGSGCVLMWKMDGSTVVAEYNGGRLKQLSTRGNGEVGSDITHNAAYIKGLPKKIGFAGKLVVRGEALMSYREFDRINAAIDEEDQYANPRNLANATISMLDPHDWAGAREIQFMAFDLVYHDPAIEPDIPEKTPYPFDKSAPGKFLDSFTEQLLWLGDLGFQVVPFENVPSALLEKRIAAWSERVGTFEYPVDGLVVALDDRVYATAQPSTGHNPHYSVGYALKWQDETEETILRDIEWSASRTGLLNPIAVFDTVSLEGTSVTRASMHNAGYVLQMDLKTGDRIAVYKANKIIPQVSENLDKAEIWEPLDGIAPSAEKMRRNHIPELCPCCGGSVTRAFAANNAGEHSDTFIACCENPDCPAKLLGKLEHFVERDCMNIIGLSTATLEKMLEKGWIREFADLYHLGDPENSDVLGALLEMDGFGEKSVRNLLTSIEASRDIDFVSFVQALGIPNVGKGQAKMLKNWLVANYRDSHFLARESEEGHSRASLFDALCLLASENFDFTSIDGFGAVLAGSLSDYIRDHFLRCEDTELKRLLKEISFRDEWGESSPAASSQIAGKTFVVTGKVEHFPNREALHADIEARGGKTAGSVSKNTDYLINNDVTSTSGKNKKAKELGVPIISEADYLALVGGN